MYHKAIALVAPALQNSSCAHPRYTNSHTLAGVLTALTFGDVLQATVISMLTLGILVANCSLILVINSRRYAKYIHSQPRYLLTSLASNDLAMGLLVTPLALLPSVRHCWPFSELVCQIQALLRGALSQQSAVILICMAMDRYLCMLHPARYHKHSSKKGCVAVISLTWITSVTLFAVLVLPKGGYYFNPTGLVACEPFYPRSSLRILAACCFYFPTTMILMYCYGSAFHVNRLRLRHKNVTAVVRAGACTNITGACTNITATAAEDSISGVATEKLISHERRLSTNASRTMAAMSLGFIVLVTPWSIQEVVAACTGTRAPPALDFLATWLALSNGFWNPFLYWLLNDHFRRISRELLFNKFLCRQPKPDVTSKSHQRCCNSNSSSVATGGIPPIPASRGDFEGLSEKYWGEILERTLSSNSLQALQKVYGHHPQSKQVSAKCNGTLPLGYLDVHHPHHEMRVLERTSLPDL